MYQHYGLVSTQKINAKSLQVKNPPQKEYRTCMQSSHIPHHSYYMYCTVWGLNIQCCTNTFQQENACICMRYVRAHSHDETKLCTYNSSVGHHYVTVWHFSIKYLVRNTQDKVWQWLCSNIISLHVSGITFVSHCSLSVPKVLGRQRRRRRELSLFDFLQKEESLLSSQPHPPRMVVAEVGGEEKKKFSLLFFWKSEKKMAGGRRLHSRAIK